MSQSTSEKNRSKYNKPLSGDEMQQVMKTGMMLMAGGFVFMVVSTALVHFDAIRLYPSSMNEEVVRGYAGRIEYALRYQTLLVTWLVFNIVATIYGRITTKALNPLDETSEEQVQHHKNILTNSFEQIIISVLAQLIFVSFASPASVLKFIPLINIIQFVGRIGFFLGYPLKRAFGFHCSFVPTMVLVVYNFFKFFCFIFNI